MVLIFIMENELTEPDWKALYMAHIGRREIVWAQKALAEALCERADCKSYEILRHIDLAEKYLQEFRNELVPVNPMTEDEADMSMNIHTYFRKCDDSAAGTLIYNLRNLSIGNRAWQSFIHLTMKIIEDELYLLDANKFNRLLNMRRGLGIDDGDNMDKIMELAIASWCDIDQNYYQMVKHFI